MPAIDPASLLSSAGCYNCFGPLTTTQLMRLALLRDIVLAGNPNAMTDPQSLMTQANCFSCFSNASMGDLMELALLAQIVQNGSTGGGGGAVNQIIAGTGIGVSPVGGTGNVTITATGGSAGGIVGTGAPNGSVVGSVGQNYTDSAAQTFWIKETGNATNTGWVQFI
jgi:hypothetical protein